MEEQNFVPYEKLSNSPKYSALPLEEKLAECNRHTNLAIRFLSRLTFTVTETRRNPNSIDILFEDNLGGLTVKWVKGGIDIPHQFFSPYPPSQGEKYTLKTVDAVLTQQKSWDYWEHYGEDMKHVIGSFEQPFIGETLLTGYLSNTRINVRGGVYQLNMSSEDINAIVQGKVSKIRWDGTYQFHEPVKGIDDVIKVIISDFKKILLNYLGVVVSSYEPAIKRIEVEIQEEAQKPRQKIIRDLNFERGTRDIDSLRGNTV